MFEGFDKWIRANWLMLLGLQVIHIVDFGHTSPTVRINLEENRIADYRDMEYVGAIMRMAKSAEMRNFMNPDEDVCENFYEFACGNWPRLNPAETTLSRKTSIFDLLASTYKQKQLRVLNQLTKRNDDEDDEEDPMEDEPMNEKVSLDANADTVKKVKDFYRSCRQMSLIKKEQVVQEMRSIIGEFGQMPALLEAEEEWTGESTFDCFTLLGSIQHRYGFDIILQLGLRPDFDNKSEHTLFVGQPSLSLGSKPVYQGVATKRLREDYQNAIEKNLEDFLGLNVDTAKLAAKGILDLEIQMAEGLTDFNTEKSLKASSIKRSREELQTLYGEDMNFLKFLETTLGYELNVTCYEYSPHYHEVLKEVLHRSPKAQVANYIMYKLVEPFFMAYDRSYADLEDICLEKTKRFFNHILDNMVFRSYDTKALQYDIVTIWLEIKHTFRQQINTSRMEWMTDSSRKMALEKLDRMQLHINSYEHHNFSQDYEQLLINDHHYVDNLKALHNRRVLKFLQQLRDTGKIEMSIHELAHSPAYINEENAIIIPVSLLQPNYLWSSHYPQALKFGTLGFLLAHELLHGFSDIGSLQFYDNGTQILPWWDDVSFKAFKVKRNCFKHQYGHFRYNGKYLPTSDMQSENIADNGAIQLAYKAYIRWLNQQSLETLEELLPNMKLNNKKMLFLSFAQFFCVDVDDVMPEKVSFVDIHAPAKFRVIGPLANFPEFAKIFKCPAGSTMNPSKRCEIY
ncbi:membrane metallo-endopeptidase-like 1 [Haematobia irritans]|uniref:membrane metallo-endopeptidase-like 1 n=1 Tax=Haematobia irritans TaxID=7368 RepID=UPI003F4FFEF8